MRVEPADSTRWLARFDEMHGPHVHTPAPQENVEIQTVQEAAYARFGIGSQLDVRA